MAESDLDDSSAQDSIDNAVAQGGAYEVIRKRLTMQGQALELRAADLNRARLDEFGSSDMSVLSRVRVRTENNCVARDIVQVGGHLLFGYNVYIGLKKETNVADVFALFDLEESDDGFEMRALPLAGTFLNESAFLNDFEELYRYYKHTRLVELTASDGKILAGFQIGERLDDLRVFRWAISADGSKIEYIDNRGERDIQLPPAYDFEWNATTREDTVHGDHPHVNIVDRIFVNTVNGFLTIKIENNTETGLGIHREPVEDSTQSIDDAEIEYASVGELILLKVLPYREQESRFFVFNRMTEEVRRIDELGQSCVQLPEDHGVIFPGGIYLQTGESKNFDENLSGLKFRRAIRSPNGEDILFVFYDPDEGMVGLFAYNIINKQLQNPIYGHGHALAEDGRLVIFMAETEPTRVHPMQVWQTPYVSDDFASLAGASQTFLGKIGNAELVRGVSDLYSVCRLIENESVTSQVYEQLNKSSRKVFDDHYWLGDPQAQEISSALKEIAATAELVIDEFEKVKSIREQSAKAMQGAENDHEDLLRSIQPDSWASAEEYVDHLERLRRQRGHLATIKEYRYINVDRIVELDDKLVAASAELSERTVMFLSDAKALDPYVQKLAKLNLDLDAATKVSDIAPISASIEETASGLDLLSELMGTLKVEDSTVRTAVLDAISQIYSQLNQTKANAKHKQKSFGSSEAIAQFGAQFKLFSQSTANALSLANDPEKCDEQLSRLLVLLEELESQFSDHDEFLPDILDKREEVYEAFGTHKQLLLDERQRKAQSVSDAAERILASIEKHATKFNDADDLNTYFASDALVMKSRELSERLRELGSAVKADDTESRFKAIKQQALRSLRDKSEIFEDDGNVIKLGPTHRFSVNHESLDLTIIPRNDGLCAHITGTDYYDLIDDPQLVELKPYWDVALESESETVYRSEYLAALIIDAAQTQSFDLDVEKLNAALIDDDSLTELVRKFASPRYKEAYEKGIHDHDAALILRQLLPAIRRANLLRFDPMARGLAQVFWANIVGTATGQFESGPIEGILSYETWPERAQSALQMRDTFASQQAFELLASEIRCAISAFLEQHPIGVGELDVERAAQYLVSELGRERIEFIGSKYANDLVAKLKESLGEDSWRNYQRALGKMLGSPAARWHLTTAWLQALVLDKDLVAEEKYIPEAVAIINAEERLDRRLSEVDLELTIGGLLGTHPTISERSISFSVDSFLRRMEDHKRIFLPNYLRYLEIRKGIISAKRKLLRIEDFKPRPLSSFVRNKLISESYLSLIGDNFAKQMGTVGEDKRTDLMGLLMMISPPGYGKTTLMEYVANRLGLIFMKINCPSLGREVLSLDPAKAPNATAEQELNKLNLALEMGNNVMLYLDDIQHTHPEFLQKFISLCDGTRRIDGVWKGETKAYDMRGRKFAVVMAGNPYTESGETFKVPDMLANRADIYNLGDILSGMDEQFALSYIENSLTSNRVLAPLASREMADVYTLIDLAKGKTVATTDLVHEYSSAEINEITEILKKMFVVQDAVLKINQQYIASAAQNDKYRTEPPFKLQGSYRNMNKLTEKLSAAMNDGELDQMISDHYLGEAQLLTNGAEDNLLKLEEIRGSLSPEQSARWEQIKADFLRNKAFGGEDADVGNRMVVQLADLVSGVQSLSVLAANSSEKSPGGIEQKILQGILEKMNALAVNAPANVEVINQPVPGMDKTLKVLAETIEFSIFPLVRHMDKKLEIDLGTYEKIKELAVDLDQLRAEFKRESSAKRSE